MKSEGTPGSQGSLLVGRAANFGSHQFRHQQSRNDMYGIARLTSQIGIGVESVVTSPDLSDHRIERISLRDELVAELMPQVIKIRKTPKGPVTTQTDVDRQVAGVYARVFKDGRKTILELAGLIDLDHDTRFINLISQVGNTPNQFGNHIRHHLLEGLLASADPNRVLSTFMLPGYALVPNVVIAAPYTTARGDAWGNIQMDAVLMPEAGIRQFRTIYDYMAGTEDPDIHVIEHKATQRVRDGMHPKRRPADTTTNLGQMQAMMRRLLLRQYDDYGRGDVRRCPIFPLPRTVQVVYARGLFEPTTSGQMIVDAAYLRDCATDWKDPGPESRELQRLVLSQADKRAKIERRTIFNSRKRHLPASAPTAPTAPTRKSSTTPATRRR